jgi:hypothetical protein
MINSRHRPHDRLGERFGLAGDPDQEGRLGVSDDIDQRDLVRIIECPGFDRSASVKAVP